MSSWRITSDVAGGPPSLVFFGGVEKTETTASRIKFAYGAADAEIFDFAVVSIQRLNAPSKVTDSFSTTSFRRCNEL